MDGVGFGEYRGRWGNGLKNLLGAWQGVDGPLDVLVEVGEVLNQAHFVRVMLPYEESWTDPGGGSGYPLNELFCYEVFDRSLCGWY